MTDLVTERLSLHAVDVEAAEAIHGISRAGQAWVEDFPFEGDLAALGGFLAASEAHGEQRPFGYYLIRRGSDGLAIGGIGFTGPPTDGVVEIGYGLAASARGHAYAAEAVAAILGLAASLGVCRVDAETEPDNGASIRTLQRNNFAELDAGPDGNRRWSCQLANQSAVTSCHSNAPAHRPASA